MNSIKEEVTQADREMAASVAVATELRPIILEGRMDGHIYTQAFARHRLQSTSDLRAKAEGLAEALRQIAFMRPAGDVERCSKPRQLVEQIEKVAIQALPEWGEFK